MKSIGKLIFLAYLLMGVVDNVMADPVSEAVAKKQAEQLLSFKRGARSRSLERVFAKPELRCVKYGIDEGDTPTFYIFNRQGDPGFAIIAGDDCMDGILAYSLENNIDADNMPEALMFCLGNYDAHVKSIRANGASSPRKVGPIEPGEILVEPYIKTKWNQREPYNWLVPYGNDGNRMPTGCVPTAVAQMMYFYKWPNNSYYRQYDWNAMRDTYASSSSYSYAEGMAVATLLRDIGVILDTRYQPTGSSTSIDPSKMPGFTYTKASDLNTVLATDPLFVSISDTRNNFNHAVIIDGRDANDLYHVNWGWGGNSDGYYHVNDLAIIYNKREVHPALQNNWMYVFTPDKETDIVAPVAEGGITIDKETAKDGDKIKVTLHRLKLASGKRFEGKIGLYVYNAIRDKYYSYTTCTYYGYVEAFAGVGTKYADSPTVWDSSESGKDLEITMTLGYLTDGNYVLVPVCYNELDGTKAEWKDLLKYADDEIIEEIPFESKNGQFTFKVPVTGDYDLSMSQVVTASHYCQGCNSAFYASVTNKGQSDFTGILTAELVGINNTKDTKSIDVSIHVPANDTLNTSLNANFDFTGSYKVNKVKIWKQLRSGEKKTYLTQSIEGSEFSILPKDGNAFSTGFFGQFEIDVIWNGNTPLVNDSVYKGEDFAVKYYAYTTDADSADIDVELWALPLSGGLPVLVGKDSTEIYQTKAIYHKITSNTMNLVPGFYKLFVFGRIGNDVNLFDQPNIIGQGYELTDFITDNILYVEDSGIELPMLRVWNWKPLKQFYYDTYNPSALEIENIGTTDFFGVTAEDLRTDGAINIMGYDPFRIRAGAKAVIYPQIYRYGEYSKDVPSEGILKVRVNNGVRDFYIPVESGTVSFDIMDKPEKQETYSRIVFYYKNNLSQRPSKGFYSKGTVKRSVWKGDKLVLTCSDIRTDDTYLTASRVCPDGEEIKDLPVGDYLLKFNVVGTDGSEWPEIVYVMIVDEEDSGLSVENVKFATDKDYSYDTDIPFSITLNNPEAKDISTVVHHQLIRLKQNGQSESYYYDREQYQLLTLLAQQQMTFDLNTSILRETNKVEGNVLMEVSVCKTKRENGHLDFYPVKSSEMVFLPFDASTGITDVTFDGEKKVIAYYTIEGHRINNPVRGIYIVKYSDGTAKKVVMQ